LIAGVALLRTVEYITPLGFDIYYYKTKKN